MSIGKTILRNTTILVIAQLIQRLFSLLLIIAIARRLGDYNLGKYSYSLALGGLLVVIADFGINVFLVREVASNKKKLAGILLHPLSQSFFCLLLQLLLYQSQQFFYGPYLRIES